MIDGQAMTGDEQRQLLDQLLDKHRERRLARAGGAHLGAAENVVAEWTP